MIRYRITNTAWRAAIEAVAPTWMSEATSRTSAYITAGRYVEPPTPIWTKIKSVYMEVQGYKCGFCERKLERSVYGSIEHDVEHFRPKGLVDAWPPASAPERGDGLTFPLGAAADPGYFRLAHHWENYLISCKTCNTPLKHNGFPIGGTRDTTIASPRTANEQHYLVYPVGQFDDDPQKLIRFEGIVPIPAAQSGHRRRRGQVIINFFQLAEREGLLEERAITILGLHLALISTNHTNPFSRQLANDTIDRMTANTASHANCARCFVGLWQTNQPDAEQISHAAANYLATLP